MKVLHVEAGRHLYGGARQVLYLLEGLARRGVANVLVAPRDSAVLEPAGAFAAVEAIGWRGDLDLAVIWRILACIRRHRPDLVHLHSRRGADVLGLIAARLAGVPAIVTRRVDNPEPALVARLKYGMCAQVIAISAGIARVLEASGAPASRVVTVRSAVDAAAFDRPCAPEWFRDTFRLGEQALALGVVAQLIPRKGHRYLLDVLPGLLGRFPALQVLFFGRGPLEAELRARAAAPELAGRVQLAGFRDDIERILPCLDLVVHPAEIEGLGVALLQAAAAGVPVVATRAGGIPEVVRDGENGLLFDVGDRTALATAVARLLGDEALRRQMGAQGRALVRGEFSVDAMVEGNLAVYRRVRGASGT